MSAPWFVDLFKVVLQKCNNEQHINNSDFFFINDQFGGLFSRSSLIASFLYSEESAKQLKEITDSQWINECTREITLEFAVYTPFLRAIR